MAAPAGETTAACSGQGEAGAADARALLYILAACPDCSWALGPVSSGLFPAQGMMQWKTGGRCHPLG